MRTYVQLALAARQAPRPPVRPLRARKIKMQPREKLEGAPVQDHGVGARRGACGHEGVEGPALEEGDACVRQLRGEQCGGAARGAGTDDDDAWHGVCLSRV
jgi:hypothetical protein